MIGVYVGVVTKEMFIENIDTRNTEFEMFEDFDHTLQKLAFMYKMQARIK